MQARAHRRIFGIVTAVALALAAGGARATDCSAAAFRLTPRDARSALAARCLAEQDRARAAAAAARAQPNANPAPPPVPEGSVFDTATGPNIDNGGSQPQRGLRPGNGSVAFLKWDVVERDNGSLTILLTYRYDGAKGEAWIGAEPMIKGEESRLFGYAPAQALVGTGLVQVHVSLVKDRATPLCTDALKVKVYTGNPFHEAVLPYRHCWLKAPHGPTDPLVPRSQPERQDLQGLFKH